MAVASTATMGQDVFLRLLTTQLKHQDPLEPLNGTEFVTQLAQFSQLEQSTGMNERLDTLVQSNVSLNNHGVTALIGKEVQVLGGSIVLEEGVSSDLSFQLEKEAQEVVIQVSDASGGLVRVMRLGPQASGTQSAQWDGLNQGGTPLASGIYQFDIIAKDTEGEAVNSIQFSRGTVNSVLYEENVPYLMVGEEKVLAADVVSVR